MIHPLPSAAGVGEGHFAPPPPIRPGTGCCVAVQAAERRPAQPACGAATESPGEARSVGRSCLDDQAHAAGGYRPRVEEWCSAREARATPTDASSGFRFQPIVASRCQSSTVAAPPRSIAVLARALAEAAARATLECATKRGRPASALRPRRFALVFVDLVEEAAQADGKARQHVVAVQQLVRADVAHRAAVVDGRLARLGIDIPEQAHAVA